MQAFWPPTRCAGSAVYALSGSALIPAPAQANARLARYYRAATRLSSAFALFADTSMLALGGELKRRERLSARLGDILAQLYLISATLKRFEDDGRPDDDLPLVRLVAFPFGVPHAPAGDALSNDIAAIMQTPGAARERLVGGSHVSMLEGDPIGRGEARRCSRSCRASRRSKRASAMRSGPAKVRRCPRVPTKSKPGRGRRPSAG